METESKSLWNPTTFWSSWNPCPCKHSCGLFQVWCGGGLVKSGKGEDAGNLPILTEVSGGWVFSKFEMLNKNLCIFQNTLLYFGILVYFFFVRIEFSLSSYQTNIAVRLTHQSICFSKCFHIKNCNIWNWNTN